LCSYNRSRHHWSRRSGNNRWSDDRGCNDRSGNYWSWLSWCSGYWSRNLGHWGRSGSAVPNDSQDCTNGYSLVLLDQNLLKDASKRRWNLGVNLVSGNLDQWLVNGNGVAYLF
jgi:hypothetical protein